MSFSPKGTVSSITYSRAQRYGSNARMLGRAHVCRSKAVFLGAIAAKVGDRERYDVVPGSGGDFLNEYQRGGGDVGSHHCSASYLRNDSTIILLTATLHHFALITSCVDLLDDVEDRYSGSE